MQVIRHIVQVCQPVVQGVSVLMVAHQPPGGLCDLSVHTHTDDSTFDGDTSDSVGSVARSDCSPAVTRELVIEVLIDKCLTTTNKDYPASP